MTKNERIAEFMVHAIKDIKDWRETADIVRGTNGMLYVGTYWPLPDWTGHTTFQPWDPEHDIRCWHGEHGILAKIEERGLQERVIGALYAGRIVAPNADALLWKAMWIVRRAEAPQLAAALVKVIEEEHETHE